MIGHRARRVADEIRRLLGDALRSARDPRIARVTLTDVEVSGDLRYATAYFVAAEGEDREEARAGLARATPFLRRALARTGGLRHTPELRFVHDDAFETGHRIDRLLDGEDGGAPP